MSGAGHSCRVLGIATLTAIFAVHWQNGFFNQNGALEFPLTIATVAVAVSATGPGRISIDHLIGWPDNSAASGGASA